MPLSNAERQAKWREKNRAIFNLRRRNARKEKGGDATCQSQSTRINESQGISNAVPTVQPAGAATIDQLREMIKVEHEKPAVAFVKPVVRRSPTGMVISEEQWEARQEYERKSREKGFIPDEYSQA